MLKQEYLSVKNFTRKYLKELIDSVNYTLVNVTVTVKGVIVIVEMPHFLVEKTENLVSYLKVKARNLEKNVYSIS